MRGSTSSLKFAYELMIGSCKLKQTVRMLELNLQQRTRKLACESHKRLLPANDKESRIKSREVEYLFSLVIPFFPSVFSHQPRGRFQWRQGERARLDVAGMDFQCLLFFFLMRVLEAVAIGRATYGTTCFMQILYLDYADNQVRINVKTYMEKKNGCWFF